MTYAEPVAVTLAGVAAVPLIVALVEAAKAAGLPPRWAGVLAVVLGLLTSLAYRATESVSDGRAWVDATLLGLALGLSAAGLYSGTRAAARPLEEGR